MLARVRSLRGARGAKEAHSDMRAALLSARRDTLWCGVRAPYALC